MRLPGAAVPNGGTVSQPPLALLAAQCSAGGRPATCMRELRSGRTAATRRASMTRLCPLTPGPGHTIPPCTRKHSPSPNTHPQYPEGAGGNYAGPSEQLQVRALSLPRGTSWRHSLPSFHRPLPFPPSFPIALAQRRPQGRQSLRMGVHHHGPAQVGVPGETAHHAKEARAVGVRAAVAHPVAHTLFPVVCRVASSFSTLSFRKSTPSSRQR